MSMIPTIFISVCLFLTSASFQQASSKSTPSKVEITGNIEWKITNNTSSEFKYCVNGGHNYISSGSTKSFSYSVGQDFYLIEGSSCGSQWFEVTSEMQGKDYKLTELL